MKLYDTYVELQIGEYWKKFYYIWLRDNCRCKNCYSAFFNQRINLVFNVPLDIKPSSCEILDEKLIIIWEDGHRSKYSVTWLDTIEFEYKPKLKTYLWDQNTVRNLHGVVIPADAYFNDSNSVKALAGNILKYGFGIVSGVKNVPDATEKVVKHFSHIHKTNFGEMWRVQTNSNCNDTSSTNVGLLPHNDNTYFTNPAGLQVFHLLEHTGEGGNTILVDGFQIANIVKNKNPEAYKILCSVPVESHFIDNDYHFMCTEPILKVHPVTKEIHQVRLATTNTNLKPDLSFFFRFNIYDRSPLTSVKDEDILKFYEALFLFGKEVDNPKNQYLLKLQSDQVIFIDNWRVMHGRTEYTGSRDLAGCYVSRDNFISSAKKLYPEL
ncbi:hypothetical protein FQR65_LT00980 [Abscondita terminalis]|nr:hypothetical protein FQR65_LT00980 [Abscondita terminalis]